MGETPNHSKDEVVVFLHDVHREGLISDLLTETLVNYRIHRTMQVATLAPAATVPHPVFAARSVTPEPVATAIVDQPASRPAPAFAPRTPKVPTRAELWARFAKKRSKRLWGTFTADFAANALTYLGVLLSVVVIFTFFAFGYFGEFIDAEHKQFRPLVEIAVVGFFLGLAWVLRHRTGIPQTSAAIEMIGIILIPIMLAASFRDGCTPSYRPWCLPPDVDGPARWAAYGVVALVSTGIYYLYARRRQIYAYLVGPMLWIAIGSFALYLEDGIGLFRNGETLRLDRFSSDGISAPQLITVLAAIGLTIIAASRLRATTLGKRLAVPLVRSGVFFTPVVLLVSLVFSYNDAVVRGIADPMLADLAWPNFIATAIATAVFVVSRQASFAWAAYSDRLRRDMALFLEIAGYLSLAGALLFTAGFGVTPAWLGAGLIGYAALVAGANRVLGGSDEAALWIVRGAAAVGAALSLIDPGPALVVWGTLTTMIVVRNSWPALGNQIARYLPTPELAIDRRVQMWVPALVATGAGAARFDLPIPVSLILLFASGLYVATRFLPIRFADVRTFAGGPAAVVASAALVMEIWAQFWGYGLVPYSLSVFLVSLAVVVALLSVPLSLRIGVVVGLLMVAAMVALRESVGSTAWETAWIDTSVLAIAGAGLVVAALVKPRVPLSVAAIGHLAVIAAVARSLVFEETAILGFAVLAAVHGVEAVRIEAGRSNNFSRFSSFGNGGLIMAVPAAVALLSLAPITALVGRQLPIVASEGPRVGPVLALLSWVYLAAAFPKRSRVRRIAVPLAYVAAATAMVASVPSTTAAIVTTTSAALLAAAVAIAARLPIASVPAWTLSVAALMLAASRAGVADGDLHLVLHMAALALVGGVAAVNLAIGRPSLGGWLSPPAVLGSVLLPLALLATIDDGSWVTWVAASAAAGLALLGWSARIGGLSMPVAVGIAVAYGSGLQDLGWAHPVDDPLVWMPLAASFITAATALPGRYQWSIMTHAAPGMLLSGLSLGTLAVANSRSVGMLDVALVAMALLLVGAHIARKHHGWLVAAAISMVAAGLVAGGYWASLATLGLALVSGYLADRVRGSAAAGPLRSLAAGSFAASVALHGAWQHWTTTETLALVSLLAAILLVSAAAAEMMASSPSRLRVWRHVGFWLSQLGAAVVIAIAFSELGHAAAAGVVAGVIGFEAVVAAVVATVKGNETMANGAAILGAAAYALVPQWLEWSNSDFVTITGAIAVILALTATAVTRTESTSKTAQLWLRPLHSLPVAAATAIVIISSSSAATAFEQWTIALVLLGLAIYASLNAWAAPSDWRIRGFATAGYVGSAVVAIAAEVTRSGAVIETTLVVAGFGLVAAIIAGLIADSASPWRVEMAWLASGLSVTSFGGAVSHYQLGAAETGIVLIIIGAGLAGYGLLARNLAAVESALVAWLGALLILGNDQIGMGLHAVVIITSVTLLGVLELERIRRDIEELPLPAALHHLEWLLMLAPLVLAATDMFQSLWFGIVLLVEGLVLAAWGTLTEVRRRALLGVGAMVLAIVLSIMIPALHGVMTGLTGGTWLAIGAGAATLFIIAGSAIERQRHAIGRHLAHLAEILEHWG